MHGKTGHQFVFRFPIKSCSRKSGTFAFYFSSKKTKNDNLANGEIGTAKSLAYKQSASRAGMLSQA
jgi:hypothetical protein